MSELDKYRKGTRGRGCVVCGDLVAGEVMVTLRERTVGNKSKHVASRSHSFCEKHATETYDALLAKFKR